MDKDTGGLRGSEHLKGCLYLGRSIALIEAVVRLQSSFMSGLG
jgi:hypothetical protein